MMALFSKKPVPKRILLVNMGGTSIGVSFLEIKLDDIPVVLYQMRMRMPISEVKNITGLGIVTLRTLESVLERAHSEGYRTLGWDSIDRVHVVLGTPWCFPSIVTVNKKNEEPRKITKKELREIIATQRSKMEASHPGTHVIESEALDVRLNGYSVPDPFGREVEAVSVDVFSSRVTGHTTENIERKISQFFSTEDLQFHSSTLTLFTTVRGVFTDGVSHLVMDITGDITEVLLVKDDVLVEIGSIPIGTNDIPRSVAETYKTTAEEALSRVRIMQDGNVGGNDIKMNAAAEKILKKWKDGLIALLDKLENSTGIPQKIFYTTDADTRSLFEDLLIDKKLFEPEDVIFLDTESLDPFVEYKTRGYKDFFLTLCSIYTHMYMSGLED